MSRFTDLFQPKPAPVVEEKEVIAKPIDKVVEIGKWKTKKAK
jgi:hypothetical protein